MISILSVLDVEEDSHVQESRMNKVLPYCSCAISAASLIPGTLGRTAPGPMWVSCKHITSHLWFSHSSVRNGCFAEDSPSMLTDITITVCSGPEFLTCWWGLSFHHCRQIVKCTGGREISRLLKS